MKCILKIGTLVFSISFLLTACGSDGGSEATYPYTYNYQNTDNGKVTCTTQAITSYSQIHLCKNLLDDQMNNFCAHDQRDRPWHSQ